MKPTRAAVAAVLGSLALAAPATAGGGADLNVTLEAKAKQKAADLKARVVCDMPCDVTLKGNARAGGEKFKLRPKSRSLEADDSSKFRLRVKRLNELEALLAEEDGVATVKIRAADARGVVVKSNIQVTLTG